MTQWSGATRLMARAAGTGALLALAWAPPLGADVQALSDFARDFCYTRPSYLDARFAPVDEKALGARRPGFGKYTLRAKTYPRDAFSMGSDERLTFVSSLRPPVGEALPRHLWHVVSVPRSQPAWHGLLTNKEAVLAGDAVSRSDLDFLLSRSKLIWRADAGDVREDPVYNWAAPPDRDQVRTLWKALVGSPIMQQVIDVNASYDHQFYYVPMPPRLELIAEASWLHPSWRKVWEPGIAFGFVLDDRGVCVSAVTIEISP